MENENVDNKYLNLYLLLNEKHFVILDNKSYLNTTDYKIIKTNEKLMKDVIYILQALINAVSDNINSSKIEEFTLMLNSTQEILNEITEISQNRVSCRERINNAEIEITQILSDIDNYMQEVTDEFEIL